MSAPKKKRAKYVTHSLKRENNKRAAKHLVAAADALGFKREVAPIALRVAAGKTLTLEERVQILGMAVLRLSDTLEATLIQLEAHARRRPRGKR